MYIYIYTYVYVYIYITMSFYICMCDTTCPRHVDDINHVNIYENVKTHTTSLYMYNIHVKTIIQIVSHIYTMLLYM